MASQNFVDYVKICCRSGKGGQGSTHMHRDKTTSKGGPDGGDGGRGGHVIIRGNSQLWTLLHLKYQRHVIAAHGEAGSGNRRHGGDGKDAIIEVPLGTLVKDAETGEVQAEITEDGQEIIATPGGRGGLGNDHFKSPTNQSPRYAQPGEDGLEEWKIVELKLLADVGLVGFPNAGKSTLLSVVSAAKPEIADYPFTTLRPNLGMVSYRDEKSFVMADIPGIIEGAAEGKGLGLRFLRHIERNPVLLFLVPADADDIPTEYKTLRGELEKYNPELMDKQHILAISKSDMLDDELERELREELAQHLETPPLFFSSVAQKGLQPLKDAIWTAINASQPPLSMSIDPALIRVLPEVQEALNEGQPVVALESTIVAHGMPYPANLETAQAVEAIVREEGAVPATVAVVDGAVQVGCDAATLERLASEPGVVKVSRRDMPVVLAKGTLGATTVSGTLIGAGLAGIPVFVTGGIGGVHRGVADSWDISADLDELARHDVVVVSAGAKSILDLPKTLEVLETKGITVLGYDTDEFPAFFTPKSGLAVAHRADTPAEVASILKAKWGLGLEGGVLVANPVPEDMGFDAAEATEQALREAQSQGVEGKALPPFLLKHIADSTEGKSLAANVALVKHNARIGARIAVAYAAS